MSCHPRRLSKRCTGCGNAAQPGRVLRRRIIEREAAILQKSAGLPRDARGHQHTEMAHGQRNVVRRSRQLRLADRNRAIAVLVESRKDLPETERLGTGDDAERAVGLPRRSRGCRSSSATERPISEATRRKWLACTAARLATEGVPRKTT